MTVKNNEIEGILICYGL